MKPIRLFIFMALLLGAFTSEIVAGGINNAVVTYATRPSPEGSVDSIWVGTAIFDPLPEYMKETKLIVTCVSRADCEHDILFWCNQQSYFRHEIELEPEEIQVPGPFEAGDTVTAEFTIKPLRVGTYDFGIQARAVFTGDEVEKFRGIGFVDAPFVIGPGGTVTALNSPEVDYRYASDLGPMPDLFNERGAVFFIDPPPYLKRLGSVSRSFFENEPLHVIHGRVEVSESADKPNTLDLKMSVSPYRDYPGGIGLEIRHTDGLQFSNLTPSIPGPIQAGQTYEFSLSVTYAGVGIHSLSLVPATANPDYLKPGGFHSAKRSRIGNILTLHLGIDGDGHLLFITDRSPGQSLELPTRVSAETIDPRYGFVRSSEQDWNFNQTTTSPNFDEAIAIERE
ncbi:MAG: hypothetical protein PVH24_07570 [Candidatus Zixiibacteriota bacterium]